MKKLILFRFACCLFAFSALLTSCSKENSEVIEEIIEEFPTSFSISIEGETVVYDAYAAYCNENGIESFSVSNNLDLIDNNLWTGSIAEDDFIIHYKKDETIEFTISGAVFETIIDGQELTVVSQDLENDVVIDELNSEQIIGSMSGVFFINFMTGETASYSVEFAAEVIPGKIPFYCQ